MKTKKEKKIKSKGVRVVLGILKTLLVLVLVAVLGVAGLFGWLTVVEYNPDTVTDAETDGAGTRSVSEGDTMRIVTWNLGYGALGDNADFFMDGGKGVQTATKDRVAENLDAIGAEIESLDGDIVFVQEIDRNSRRSYHIDEYESFAQNWDYAAFAYNYNVKFVPIPIPPMGKVESGVAVYTDLDLGQAQRIQLPCPFSWPLRVGNLKRCLLVTRIPVQTEDGTEKELVLINLHLEAYDSGEGKIAQTNQLRELMNAEREKGNYVIAGGDFNQTFMNVDASMYPELEGMWHCGAIAPEDFGDGWQLIMDNTVPTCRSLDRPYAGADHDPSQFQYYLIDGFILSDNIEVLNLQTVDNGFVATDHNPVVLDFKLAD